MGDGNFSLIIQMNKQLEIRKRLSHKELLQQLTVTFQTNVEKIYADTIREKKLLFTIISMKYGRCIKASHGSQSHRNLKKMPLF